MEIIRRFLFVALFFAVIGGIIGYFSESDKEQSVNNALKFALYSFFIGLLSAFFFQE